jgi:hypothetical protein
MPDRPLSGKLDIEPTSPNDRAPNVDIGVTGGHKD